MNLQHDERHDICNVGLNILGTSVGASSFSELIVHSDSVYVRISLNLQLMPNIIGPIQSFYKQPKDMGFKL